MWSFLTSGRALPLLSLDLFVIRISIALVLCCLRLFLPSLIHVAKYFSLGLDWNESDVWTRKQIYRSFVLFFELVLCTLHWNNKYRKRTFRSIRHICMRSAAFIRIYPFHTRQSSGRLSLPVRLARRTSSTFDVLGYNQTLRRPRTNGRPPIMVSIVL